MEKLQDIFYCFKNEAEDQLTDDELLSFMREQFEEICMGDTEYLESTCLPRLQRRSGPDTGDIRKAEETGNMKT